MSNRLSCVNQEALDFMAPMFSSSRGKSIYRTWQFQASNPDARDEISPVSGALHQFHTGCFEVTKYFRSSAMIGSARLRGNAWRVSSSQWCTRWTLGPEDLLKASLVPLAAG